MLLFIWFIEEMDDKGSESDERDLEAESRVLDE